VLKEKLYKLAGFIQAEILGVNTRVCVDTAPMMDKVWAVRAGLGWIGKSTNLITTDYGSWVFLGEIIVDRARSRHAARRRPLRQLHGLH